MAPEINSLSSESNVFHHLYEQARLLYNFASLMTTHSNHKNCSELAPTLTMTEVHLLVDIMEQPGIGVSELGRLNLRPGRLFPDGKKAGTGWHDHKICK